MKPRARGLTLSMDRRLRREPARFRRFLLAVEDGRPFADAFRSAYDRDVTDEWNGFVARVRGG